MEPLIFLDIDGVLNSARFLSERAGGEGVVIVDGQFDATHTIDPERVAFLNRLVEESGARVVLSSSWRCLFGLERTQRSLQAKGFAGRLADATVRLVGRPRHAEIRHYLAGFSRVPNFVVLDDDLGAGDGLCEHFVRVEDGLEPAHVEAALAVLRRPCSESTFTLSPPVVEREKPAANQTERESA
jgi:hypothetical protein